MIILSKTCIIAKQVIISKTIDRRTLTPKNFQYTKILIKGPVKYITNIVLPTADLLKSPRDVCFNSISRSIFASGNFFIKVFFH